MAIYFLWNYPKNSEVLASRFHTSERNSRGEPLWHWIKKIQALKGRKIVWDSSIDDPQNGVIFCLSVDGVDFKINEKQNPERNVDRKFYSKKFNHCAAKYEIAMSVFRSKVVWISGPHPGGKHDITIFREGLKKKIPQGKKIIADKGYSTSQADEDGLFAIPSHLDNKELKRFKSRVRMRHETFNARLKHFESLSTGKFRHGFEMHKIVFESVCVIVQYQMDKGSPLFDV
jgi:hypothetical protein